MKYYSLHRPITPGSYPKHADNPVLEIVNFDERTYCTDAERDAWGYIEYSKPLTEKETVEYELVREQLLDFSQRFMVMSGTSFLRTFATAAELHSWYEVQDVQNQFFCRLYDHLTKTHILGSAYMWLKDEERYSDDPNWEPNEKYSVWT